MARFAPQFPMALDPGAADYGLLFILPAGKHYVLVSSGLPWWTGAEEANRGGYRWAPEPYRLLSTLADYILFKGSLANVLAEGRFGRNGKVAPEAAGALRASGTVTILKEDGDSEKVSIVGQLDKLRAGCLPVLQAAYQPG